MTGIADLTTKLISGLGSKGFTVREGFKPDPVTPPVKTDAIYFRGGDPLQVACCNGTRTNATAGATGSAPAPVPIGGNAVMIRALGAVWISFGATAGMAVAAADANSILFVAGEAPYLLKTGEAFFSVLRIGSSDIQVQLEAIGTIS